MSEDNVELARRGFERFLAGDIGAWLELLSPEVEWHMAEDEPDARVLHGHEGVLALLADTVATFENFTFEVEDVLDAGDAVIVVTRMRGIGKGSGAEVDLPESLLFDIADGRAWRVREFREREDALRAAGVG